MRILITGISGFIGGHLYRAAPKGYEVWGTHLDTATEDIDAARVLRVDLRNQESLRAILDGVRPSAVIHCAAYSRVAFCESAPTAAWEMNSWVTSILAKMCAESGYRLIFLSSDMVFDGTKGRYKEKDDPQPINFYGWTKLAAERHVLNAGNGSVVVRVNLTYGHPVAGGSSFSEEVIETIRSGQPYHLYADQFRSFISVQNLAQCLWEIALGDFAGLIHLGGSEPTDRVTFARKLAARVNLDPDLLIPITSKAASPEIPYPKNNTFDLSLASEILKTPLLDLDEGLAVEYPS